MTDKLQEGMDRRAFVKQAGVVALAAGMDARSYGRILGANDRIRIAQLDAGSAVKAMSTWCNSYRSKRRWKRSQSAISGAWLESSGQPR